MAAVRAAGLPMTRNMYRQLSCGIQKLASKSLTIYFIERPEGADTAPHHFGNLETLWERRPLRARELEMFWKLFPVIVARRRHVASAIFPIS